jgi:hypothetical protein
MYPIRTAVRIGVHCNITPGGLSQHNPISEYSTTTYHMGERIVRRRGDGEGMVGSYINCDRSLHSRFILIISPKKSEEPRKRYRRQEKAGRCMGEG